MPAALEGPDQFGTCNCELCNLSGTIYLTAAALLRLSLSDLPHYPPYTSPFSPCGFTGVGHLDCYHPSAFFGEPSFQRA